MRLKLTVMMTCLLAFAEMTLAQNIELTFTASGMADSIHQILAINTDTGDSILFPGYKKLILTSTVGTGNFELENDQILAYPNPSSGEAYISCGNVNRGTGIVYIRSITGKVLHNQRVDFTGGNKLVKVHLAHPGVFFVEVCGSGYRYTAKLICIESPYSDFDIALYNEADDHEPPLKTNPGTAAALGYLPGDKLLLMCYADPYCTIVSDSPVASKNLDIEFVDCVDKQRTVYPVVFIGDQVWMARNLQYSLYLTYHDQGSSNTASYYVYGHSGSSLSAARNSANYRGYGMLYNWPAAMAEATSSDRVESGVQGICPDGWHLPSSSEWSILNQYLSQNSGEKMKERGFDFWESTNRNATNSSGFGGRGGGFHNHSFGDDNYFLPYDYELKENAYFWTSTQSSADKAFALKLSANSKFLTGTTRLKSEGISVRCLRGDNYNLNPTANLQIIPNAGDTTTLFIFDPMLSSDDLSDTDKLMIRWDFDGDDIWDTDFEPLQQATHQYHNPGAYLIKYEVADEEGLTDKEERIVYVGDFCFLDERDNTYYAACHIGDQVWMSQNLGYLPDVSNVDGGPYYVYDNEVTSVSYAKKTENFQKYGVLYKWAAALTACPEGWHLPTDSEWKELEQFLGMSEEEVNKDFLRTSGSVGEKLKSEFLWNGSNGTNSSGFNGFPGGGRFRTAFVMFPYRTYFSGLGDQAYYWTSTKAFQPYYRNLSNADNGVTRGYDPGDDWTSGSVRCIKGKMPEPPRVVTLEAAEVTGFSALLRAEFADTGSAKILEKGFFWSKDSVTILDDNKVTLGDGGQPFDLILENLRAETSYYFIAYGTNKMGTGMGKLAHFTTGPGFAEIQTSYMMDVLDRSAKSGGIVTFDGGSELIEVGLCWAEHQNPSFDDNSLVASTVTTEFFLTLEPLEPSTTYYVRAYVENEFGTSYGEVCEFLTADGYFAFGGRNYGYRNFGSRDWMIQNLAFLPQVDDPTDYSQTESKYYIYGYAGDSPDEALGLKNYQIYGVLYNWFAAMNGEIDQANNVEVQGICPDGWRLPSQSDWEALTDSFGGRVNAGWKLRERGNLLWDDSPIPGTDESGFSARPGGMNTDAGFKWLGSNGAFWTTTKAGSNKIKYAQVASYNRGVLFSDAERQNGLSIRCVR